MQAVALALVAAATVWAMAHTLHGDAAWRFFRRVLLVLLAVYLLSPIVAGAFGVLVMLMI